MNRELSRPRTPRFRLILPHGVVMIATAYRVETDPTIEFAIYRAGFDAGVPDTSLVSEGEFGELKIRNFFPGSGCGFILKDDKIVAMEHGLQNFIGKSATFLDIPDTPLKEILLVVWENNPAFVSREFIRDLTTVVATFRMALRQYSENSWP